jgi:hypothetical protein
MMSLSFSIRSETLGDTGYSAAMAADACLRLAETVNRRLSVLKCG